MPHRENKTTSKNRVDHRIEASEDIKEAAELPRILMGGTRALREASLKDSETYLPQREIETSDAYKIRVKENFLLYNGYKQAWDDLMGRAFKVGMKLSDDAPEPVATEWWNNIDNSGQHVDQFAAQAFGDAVHSGGGHILVDAPMKAEGATAAQEARDGWRPYFVYVPSEAVLGWQSRTVGGRERLLRVRIAEKGVTPDGEWGKRQVDRVRVLYAANPEAEDVPWRSTAYFQLHEKRGQFWEIIGEGPLEGLEDIPLFPIYFRRVGFMQTRPVLEDLAWTVLRYWQTSSDQIKSLYFDRFFMTHFAGWTKDELDNVSTWGAGARAYHANESATINVVERAGQGTSYGQEDMNRLEQLMAQQSKSAMMERKPGTVTATERAIAEAHGNSFLESMIRSFEWTFTKALRLAAQWADLDSDGINVTVDHDLSFSQSDIDQVELLSKLGMSRETTWSEAHRRGFIGEEEWSVESEKDRVLREGPPLSSFRGGSGQTVDPGRVRDRVRSALDTQGESS